MTKQKIVIKVCMPSCGRCRSKAMETIARAEGLISVAIAGDEKLEVVGDGIDSIRLVCRLRKKLCYAGILQVEEVKEKKPKPEKNSAAPQPAVGSYLPAQSCPGNCYCHRCCYRLLPKTVVCYEEDSSCAIM